MKLHKKGFTALLLALSVSIFAQKQSKKFTETFNVNKDVTIEIEASHADIDVTTWNKNQVWVEAYIEIEGLSKEEAEKYLKRYKFEALGNKSKVKITSGGNSFRFGNDFVMFDKDFKMPEIVIPEIDFEMPDIKIPEIDFDFENIVIPEINMDKLLMDIDEIDFDWDKYSKDGKEYFFKWKDGVKEIKIKSKEDWEKFKKSKEYKEWKKEMKKTEEKIKEEMAQFRKNFKFDNEKMKKEIADAMKSVEKIDMSKIKEEMAKVSKEMKEMNFDYLFDFDKGETTFNGKKVKIKKKITIKVPEGAKFDLNTRHSKVKLPDTNATGKVSYGSFDAIAINGGDLKVYSSPVNITRLMNTNLFLNNVTDAKLASVIDSEITSSSGKLTIDKVLSNVDIDLSFGDIFIHDFDSAIKNFKMELKESNASINAKPFKNKIALELSYNTKDKKYKLVDRNKKTNSYTLNRNFAFKTKDDTIKIEGKYSYLTLKF